MRRILTKEEIEKKDKKNKVTISIILVAVMTLSTAGYALFSGERTNNSKKVKYNNVDFELQNGYWYFNVGNGNFMTSNNPVEVKNITNGATLTLNDYTNKPLYFYYDGDGQSEQEILRNIQSYIARKSYACFTGENCSYVGKNCASDNIIIAKESPINQSMIKQENKCVYIFYAEGEDLKATDSFLFRILNII